MPTPEAKVCQNCKASFVIDASDFAFYEKMKVPPPTFCPACRFKRRMSWRNDWHLFKKRDAKTGKEIFSLFPNESPVKIFDKDYWFSDAWNPLDYGRDYDFSRPFFEQFKELLHAVPLPAHSMTNIVNCSYCTNAVNIKNCYLVRAATYTEDSAYLIWDHASKQCLDSHMTDRCELSYGNVNTERCYKTFFSVDCEDSQELVLSNDCNGCTSLIGCVGLRNASYRIWNKQYTKEEYHKKLEKFDLGSAAAFEKLKEHVYAHWLRYPRRFMHGRQNSRVTGDYIYESKNAHECFRVRSCEDVKYCANILSGPARDCYDYANWGENCELLYECLICGMGVSNLKFCAQTYENMKNAAYCIFCKNGSDMFGCISVRGKQHCILNKQYTRMEYETLLPKIIDHMNAMPYISQGAPRAGSGQANSKEQIVYRYGEFFPPELSPFPYGTTAAYEFFPMNEREARAEGYQWYPTKKQSYTITLAATDIPDHINDTNDSMLNEIIGCAHKGACAHECTDAFRIVKQELEFCRRMNIPLPRICTNCRHGERLALRNPPRFYRRSCQCTGTKSENGVYVNTGTHTHGAGKCPNEFETSYAPDRPEIVYCEQCYNAEVV